jgi:ABC-type transport system involved in multi-copper enzyme maturation permease subunit
MRTSRLESRLPLLHKELIEQAARPRTYVVRTVYALCVFAGTLFFIYGRLARAGEAPTSILGLGFGREIFRVIVWGQVIGIVVLLPAMLAGTITRERERNCLDLLLLTGLRPWDIVLQKMLSRVVPMAMFLTVSFPLLAVSLTYGGVTGHQVWTAAYVLLLTVLEVGAVATYLAVEAPNASAALLSVYARLPLHGIVILAFSHVIAFLFSLPVSLAGEGSPKWLVLYSSGLPFLLLGAEETPPLHVTLPLTLPAWLITWLYVRRARDVLLKVLQSNPALPPPPSFELAAVPGTRAHRAPGDLPGDAPVAWRELSSQLWLQLKAVYRVAVGVNLPVFLFMAFAVGLRPIPGGLEINAFFPLLSFGIWLIAASVVLLLAASSFARERSGQTLDVLLVTPLSTGQILREKLAVARRCAWLAAVPLGVTALLEAWHELGDRSPPQVAMSLYLLTELPLLAAYLPLCLWLGAGLGMRVKDRGRALLLGLGLLLLWAVALPLLLHAAWRALGIDPGASWWGAASLLSPATAIACNHQGTWLAALPHELGWLAPATNLACYGALAVLARRFVLRRAGAWLGRVG